MKQRELRNYQAEEEINSTETGVGYCGFMGHRGGVEGLKGEGFADEEKP